MNQFRNLFAVRLAVYVGVAFAMMLAGCLTLGVIWTVDHVKSSLWIVGRMWNGELQTHWTTGGATIAGLLSGIAAVLAALDLLIRIEIKGGR